MHACIKSRVSNVTCGRRSFLNFRLEPALDKSQGHRQKSCTSQGVPFTLQKISLGLLVILLSDRINCTPTTCSESLNAFRSIALNQLSLAYRPSALSELSHDVCIARRMLCIHTGLHRCRYISIWYSSILAYVTFTRTASRIGTIIFILQREPSNSLIRPFCPL